MKKNILILVLMFTAAAAAWIFFNRSTSIPAPSSQAAAAPGYPAGISLSVNHGLHTKILRGWPVIAEVFLIFPEGSALEPALRDSWQDKITLELRTEKGLQPVDFQKIEPEAEGAEWTGVWILTPEATQKLEPGQYQLKAVLNDKGKLVSKSYFSKVEVLAEAEKDLQPETGAYLNAEALILQKRFPEAAKIVDDFLKTHPDDAGMTEMKAGLLRSAGQPEEALELYDKALGPSNMQEPPPESLMRRRHELLHEVLTQDHEPQGERKPA
ncbi:MAG TPA: hypothetical protein VL688_02700 [Verrucomicrobiae bacterium]|jgi:hypothetical protein|nr:hypothetical protein [Verrucomicrobiae bacterium]